VREKLGADESAAIRSQLIQEIEALPEDDLQFRAIAILKAKNRLSADDAKLVEDAFSARMVLQGALPEILTADRPSRSHTAPGALTYGRRQAGATAGTSQKGQTRGRAIRPASGRLDR
jgi:hypothetical protein